MLLPSEIESKSLIPAIRAILSKKLIHDYIEAGGKPNGIKTDLEKLLFSV